MLESSAREGELATRAAGARVLAIGPIPSTFAWLARNIAGNGWAGAVGAAVSAGDWGDLMCRCNVE